MKLHIVHDVKDHNKLTVHLDVNLDKFRVKPEVWRDSNQFNDFDGFDDLPSSASPVFRNRLLQIKGIQGVAFDKYSIDIIKGEVFIWRVLVEQIKAMLELELNEGELAKYSGAFSRQKAPLKKMAKKSVCEKAPKF